MLKQFTDQLNRTVSIPYLPKRIISLVPSQTELLFSLGLDEEIVGITKFCVHPKDKFKSKAKVGGTKTLKLDIIRKLQPDLIIGNKEENEPGQIEQLMEEFPVWMSDINNLNDALQMIKAVGAICGKDVQAKKLVQKVKTAFQELPKTDSPKPRVAYFIWKNPYMLAGSSTFIDEIISLGGWQNACQIQRYPAVSREELIAVKPDIIFLSSEPYPFTEKHVAEFKAIFPDAQVIVVDGEMFSWYGSRLQYAPKYLYSLKQQIDRLKS